MSLKNEQLNAEFDRVRLLVRSLIIAAYVLALVVIALIVLRDVISGWDILDSWPVICYSLLTRIVLFSWLLTSGYKLLRLIKKYSTVKPTKLLWSIYLIISLIGIYLTSMIANIYFNSDGKVDSIKEGV
jgi:hypothetical protein